MEPVGLAEPVAGGAGRSPARWKDQRALGRRRRAPGTSGARPRCPGGCARPRTSSAPAAASVRRTALRCLSGNFREARQGALARWWWQTTIRSAPAGASARTVAAVRGVRRRACRPGGATGAPELRPQTTAFACPQHRVGRAEDRLEGLPRARDARRERVGDVVVPGHGERRHRQPVEERLGILELAARQRFERSPLAITSSG